jgi:hypothetical protein
MGTIIAFEGQGGASLGQEPQEGLPLCSAGTLAETLALESCPKDLTLFSMWRVLG